MNSAHPVLVGRDRRARRAGSLCKPSLKATAATSWPLCENSMLHVVNQLKAARKFEAFVDGISGGPGLGWFRIVTTPQEARAAVRAGKLAVVNPGAET